MPKLNKHKPLYEKRTKRQFIEMFAPKKSFNAFKMWCRKHGIKTTYSEATFRRYALTPKNFVRFASLSARLRIVNYMVELGELPAKYKRELPND